MNQNEEPTLMSMFNQESSETTPPATEPMATSAVSVIPDTPVEIPSVSISSDGEITSEMSVEKKEEKKEEVIIVDTTSNNETNSSSVESRIQDAPLSAEDTLLLQAFMGENANLFASGGFNFGAFCFGAYYFLYRKMVVYGLIIVGVTLLLNVFIKSTLLSIGVGAVCGFIANKIYLNFSMNKVKKIRKQNPTASEEELKELCKKAGGTSYVIPAVTFFATVAVAFVLVMIVAFFSVLVGAAVSTISQDTNVAGSEIDAYFEFKSPSSHFKRVDSSSTVVEYAYIGNNGKTYDCRSTLYLAEGVSSADEAIQSYEQYSEDSLKVDTVELNGLKWKNIMFDDGEFPLLLKNHIYVTEEFGKVYVYSMQMGENAPDDCMDVEEKFLKTIQKK